MNMLDKNYEHLMEQLVKIEKDKLFVMTVLSMAKEWNAIDFISEIIDKYEIDDKQILLEVLLADYD